MENEKRKTIVSEFAAVINSHSLENESNTPDFILAEYLVDCLDAHTKATQKRDNWYGGKQSILDSEKLEKW